MARSGLRRFSVSVPCSFEGAGAATVFLVVLVFVDVVSVALIRVTFVSVVSAFDFLPFATTKLSPKLNSLLEGRLSSVSIANYPPAVKHATIKIRMITVTSALLVLALSILLIVMNVRLHRSFTKFKMKKNYTAAVEAPSVSVCIPARNETHAMTQCLERVLASDYKKLEIIVFDDSSVDDTSILIRSFAHAGVRFVPGTKLPEGWLGKNHALEVLAREASGTYVVFMDVDTFIRPTTISQLIGYTMTEKAEMVSVIPGRADVWRPSTLFGHLRYFWELILSRRDAPASASSLWVINRRTLLEKFGGFGQLRASVAPETKLASLFGEAAYRCLVTNEALGVTYEKKWSSQVETARRLLYPMVGGSWWRGMLAVVALVLLNVPFLVVCSGVLFGWTAFHTICLLLLTGFIATYAYYTANIWSRAWWLGGLLWPVVVLQELVLMVQSMWGYTRRTITWKGRLVTAATKSEAGPVR